jgi:hypothetical protein
MSTFRETRVLRRPSWKGELPVLTNEEGMSTGKTSCSREPSSLPVSNQTEGGCTVKDSYKVVDDPLLLRGQAEYSGWKCGFVPPEPANEFLI